jgi:hypothetical protein
VTFPFIHLSHLSAVRATPAFFCTHGALPWQDRQFLTLRERKRHVFTSIYIYKLHLNMRVFACYVVSKLLRHRCRIFGALRFRTNNAQTDSYIFIYIDSGGHLQHTLYTLIDSVRSVWCVFCSGTALNGSPFIYIRFPHNFNHMSVLFKILIRNVISNWNISCSYTKSSYAVARLVGVLCYKLVRDLMRSLNFFNLPNPSSRTRLWNLLNL